MIRCKSAPLLIRNCECLNCELNVATCSLKCLLCDTKYSLHRAENKMNVTHSESSSSCKNCLDNALTLTPVEHPQSLAKKSCLFLRHYNTDSHRRPKLCSCQPPPQQQTNRVNFVTNFSCPTAQESSCDTTMDKPNNIRTTSSGISCSNGSDSYDATPAQYKSKNYSWKRNSAPPGVTWTCKRCTLLNNSNSVFCEACESPFQPDLNSNISPSVLIKVRLFVFAYMLHQKIVFFSIFVSEKCG